MSGGEAAIVDAVDPSEAYDILATNADAQLIDVRTRAELTFVGLPDLSPLGRDLWPLEWVEFPSMSPNHAFLDQLRARRAAADSAPSHLLFICRSGGRSLAAARLAAGMLAEEGVTRCTNVAEGFEGDLDAEGHRGNLNGWKHHGLPWRQG